ncbi:MAG: hypothetical protein ABIJ96_08415 [Elusimicrobiota bacterium]
MDADDLIDEIRGKKSGEGQALAKMQADISGTDYLALYQSIFSQSIKEDLWRPYGIGPSASYGLHKLFSTGFLKPPQRSRPSTRHEIIRELFFLRLAMNRQTKLLSQLGPTMGRADFLFSALMIAVATVFFVMGLVQAAYQLQVIGITIYLVTAYHLIRLIFRERSGNCFDGLGND